MRLIQKSKFKNQNGCEHFMLGYKKGMYLPIILMASVLFIAFAVAVITISLTNVKMANLHNNTITSMSIAEAGINYYLWHLAHDNEDYCDGNACVGSPPYGPFTHTYKDQLGNSLGAYDLYITPPGQGSSTVQVKAVGRVGGTSPQRTVIAELGIPSFTKYTLLVNNNDLWVGSNEKIEGSVHINHSGVRNDGEITGNTTSTELTYHSMFGDTRDGINGTGVFGGSKAFPVPAIDFNQLDVDVTNLRNNVKAQTEGYYDSSGKSGYHIILGGNSYEIRKVTGFNSSEYNITTESVIGSYSYPAKGVIFCEDNVWIEGKIENQQITVVAADPEANPSKKKRIIIPNKVLYTSYDGKDKIGLITQTNILLTRNAPSVMEIDAAMIAKDGEIRIDSYCSPSLTCMSDRKTSMKVYGSMAHTKGLIWTYDYGGGKYSGYASTQTVIDQHNVINPPPNFPLTGTYAVLSWREE